MPYSLTTLWYERSRFLPGVLAVAFSALLIALQCGLLLGLFSITSLPIDRTRADLWVGSPGVLSVDLGVPIYERRNDARLWLVEQEQKKELASVEPFVQGFGYWTKPTGGRELCMVIGSRLTGGSLGIVNGLTPEHRAMLTEPDTIVIDESDLERLGIGSIGERAEINGSKVRVVGTTIGLKSLAGPYVFCSLRTAQKLLRRSESQVTYLLAKCHNPKDAPKIVQRLRKRYKDLSVFTSQDFSTRSRLHWLFKTKAGIALGYAAILGLLVGAVVTSQTLYAATAASMRELAVLRALGIPRWRIGSLVMMQSFWIGIIGIFFGLVGVHLANLAANQVGANIHLPWWLLVSSAGVTMLTALFAGLVSLRSLRLIEPAMLLR